MTFDLSCCCQTREIYFIPLERFLEESPSERIFFLNEHEVIVNPDKRLRQEGVVKEKGSARERVVHVIYWIPVMLYI